MTRLGREFVLQNPEASLDVLMQRVDTTGDCWVWTGPVTGNLGHPMVSLGQRGVWEYGHRISWMAAHGDPGVLWVLHNCDVPRCCRASHLYTGTQADNMADAARRGRVGGVAVGLHKEVRAAHLAGVSISALSRQYGVGRKHVSRIIENWSK